MSLGRRLEFVEVRRFCASRPVELSLVRGELDGALAIHAGFEGHGDFFLIEAVGVEYAELPGTCWVGGLYMGPWQEVAASKPKWTPRRQEHSGVALVFWDDDARSLADAPELHCYAIVADSLVFTAGKDWQLPSAQ